MPELQDALHAELRACLAASGLSQAEVARRAEITPKHLCQVLLNQAVISLSVAQRVAEACGRELLIKSRRTRKETPHA
jgi:transcriptional regulator with XRE-family HTH domain